jgi:uncharacterized protein
MEPENQPLSTTAPAANHTEPVPTPGPVKPSPAEPAPPAELAAEDEPYRGLRWIFIGPQGLRAGWSVLMFVFLFYAFNAVIDIGMLHFHLIDPRNQFAPRTAFFAEAGGLLALILAVTLVGLIEGRRILAYNLTGPRRPQHFLVGVAAGFLGISALVGTLLAGGWLRFGPVALSGAAIFRYALVWGCIFLMAASIEEGMFRCYLQFTFTRGINFWWALGIVAVLCSDMAIRVRGGAAWGVYAAALMGVVPCYILHQKAAPRSGTPGSNSGFWYAAWVTSTLFGFVHVSNPNEAWIGIFAAALIGFVLCVSVRVTGSAWWAIGCHAGWDWGETYLYGTADSGLSPQGSYLTSSPAGNPLWSGGAVGPEGSLLVLGALLFLLALVLIYARMSARTTPAAA